jgi:DNA-binding NtrC family response regulator
MRKKSILLVDDERPILLALGNYLKKNNFEVQTAESGELALALFRSSFFDLVITDLVMGGMNGIELLRAVKESDSEVGMLIFTGHGDMAFAIEALRSGADDFLLKPYDPEDLILRIERVLRVQDERRKIKIYEKILPICMYCHRIRDDDGVPWGTGKWLSLDEYLNRKTGVDLSHGCCPECYDKEMK